MSLKQRFLLFFRVSGKKITSPHVVKLTKRLPRFILSKDDAVAFFGEFLGEEVNKHLVAFVELEEQYSPQKKQDAVLDI